jgi:predicted nucleic acid-binding protein
MVYLLDTGVLLRLFDRSDPNCPIIRRAIWDRRKAGDRFVVSVQNIAEFWNVSTRPASSRGGYGLTVTKAEQRLRVLERACVVVPDSQNLYPVWRRLITSRSVMGAKVHDARIVAWMMTHAISHIVTLNVPDFARYPEIDAVTPEALRVFQQTP